MDPQYLLKDEVEFELACRGYVQPGGFASALRLILRKMMFVEQSQEVSYEIKLPSGYIKNPNKNLDVCSNKLDTILRYISELNEKPDKQLYKRLVSRLSHIVNRLNLMEPLAEIDKDKRTVLIDKAIVLLSELENKDEIEDDDNITSEMKELLHKSIGEDSKKVLNEIDNDCPSTSVGEHKTTLPNTDNIALLNQQKRVSFGHDIFEEGPLSDKFINLPLNSTSREDYNTIRKNKLVPISQWGVYFSGDGLLYKKICLKQYPDKSNDWKLYIPEILRSTILKRCHNDVKAGHLGIRKTVFRVKQYYYWPNILGDVKRHVGQCEICAKFKVSQRLPFGHMGHQRHVNRPWQIISLDLMGPFPRSKSGNTMLLVITCFFSKFVLLFPLRSGKADKICSIVESQFLLFGVPQVIISDNGKQFESKLFKELVNSYGSQIWYTPNYHPQSNPTERVNRVIGTMISSFINTKKHNEWDLHLQSFAHAVRTSVHETTGYTPSFLFFGRETAIPPKVTSMSHDAVNMFDIPLSFNAKEFLVGNKKLFSIYEKVEQKMKDAHKKSTCYYNLKRREAKFNVGDTVWKRNKFLSNAGKKFMAKLAPKFDKAIIVERLSSNVFRLNSWYGKPLGVWHAKDLKPYWNSE
ncbi:uncharacterized protein LOC125049138 [Pieris napi]|uniref:uncharacterized protein LOC125049138 n=1 Tax=Pieris napi TaxID=78633 RepID=UPI001FB9057B|nr:uncharacterized protein LOC125049138 [Pieris napi]